MVIEGIILELPGRRVTLDLIPDDRLAARASRLATRVLSVEFRGADDAHLRAEFTAVWHRVPHTRAIPMSAALALTASGVPSYVVHEDPR